MYRLGGGTLRALYVRQYAPPIDPMTGLTARHLFRVLRNQLTALELMSDLRSPWLTEGDESYGIITVRPAFLSSSRNEMLSLGTGLVSGQWRTNRLERIRLFRYAHPMGSRTSSPPRS